VKTENKDIEKTKDKKRREFIFSIFWRQFCVFWRVIPGLFLY
jgi:hypothetical protein